MVISIKALPVIVILLAAARLGPRAQSPLAALPSDGGPHIARIKALDDNSWLELGPPAPDPKWGRARGRSWTSEMPLAPELRGAFLRGEGQHGYTKPDGHYMDDLWFYDINAHRWICCYPGAPTKTVRLQINTDGFEATQDGDLVPVAQQVHGYEINTYDADGKRLMMMPNTHPYWEKPIPQRKEMAPDGFNKWDLCERPFGTRVLWLKARGGRTEWLGISSQVTSGSLKTPTHF